MESDIILKLEPRMELKYYLQGKRSPVPGPLETAAWAVRIYLY